MKLLKKLSDNKLVCNRYSLLRFDNDVHIYTCLLSYFKPNQNINMCNFPSILIKKNENVIYNIYLLIRALDVRQLLKQNSKDKNESEKKNNTFM